MNIHANIPFELFNITTSSHTLQEKEIESENQANTFPHTCTHTPINTNMRVVT